MTDNDDLGTRAGVARMAEEQQLTLIEKLTEMRGRYDAACIAHGQNAEALRDIANDIAALDAAIAVIEEATAPKPVVLG